MGEYLRLQYPSRTRQDTWKPALRPPHRGTGLKAKDSGLRPKTEATDKPSPNRRQGLPPERGTFLHRLWIFLLDHPNGVRIAAMASHLDAKNNRIRGSLNELRRRCFAKALVCGVWTGLEG